MSLLRTLARAEPKRFREGAQAVKDDCSLQRVKVHLNEQLE
jgi:hypothetical protein